MSAGKFEIVNYQLDNDTILTCRVQPETKALTINSTANTPPTGTPVGGYGSVRVGGGNRAIGIKARSITVKFNEGAEPDGYKADSPISLPIFDPAVWITLTKGMTGTYLGNAVTVVGEPTPERRN